MQEIQIHTEYIKLQQLLKLSGIIDQGSDIKILLEEKKVLLNGNVVFERGKKIRNKDIVEVKEMGKIKVETIVS